MNKELLYCIPAGQYGKEGVLSLLAQHPELAAHYAAWAGELPRAEQEHG